MGNQLLRLATGFAEQYPELINIVRRLVKPDRDKLKRDRRRERWWIYGENTPGLYGTIRPLPRVIVRARVSEMHMMALVPNGWVYSDATVVFAFDDYYHFALLQSNIHEAWVWKNASSLESRNRYTPTSCFETFALPQGPAETARVEAERIGDAYHEHRRQVTVARQLGLTKTYNQFHNPQCTDADIARLRRLARHYGPDDSGVLRLDGPRPRPRLPRQRARPGPLHGKPGRPVRNPPPLVGLEL